MLDIIEWTLFWFLVIVILITGIINAQEMFNLWL